MAILSLIFFNLLDFKGIWIPRWSIDNSSVTFRYLDKNFNHIFLQIFALGEAYYPSQIAPSRVSSDKWLKDFLRSAHQRGIKVSAWINIFYSWGYAPRPQNLSHPMIRNPDWYVVDAWGRPILDYSVSELEELGLDGYYLAPANSGVRRYIKSIVYEIISRYDFDGIHLDYTRYPNKNFIYDISLRTKFMRRYIYDPMKFKKRNELGLRLGIWGRQNLSSCWHTFLCDDLTEFIRDLRSMIKSQNRNILISVAVKPDYGSAKRDYGQDWLQWLNDGTVDFVCLMAYSKNIEGILKRTLRGVKEPHRVIIGLGIYQLKPKEITKQINLVRTTPFAGVVLFSYKEFKKNPGYLSNILR